MNDTLINLLKNELYITWEDDETEVKLQRIIKNAIKVVDYKIGGNGEINYNEAGLEQELLLAYCVYIWNGCGNEFDEAYQNDIMILRHKYEVQQYKRTQGDGNEE